MSKEAIYRRLKPGDLPSPPEAAIGVVHACSRDDADSGELSRIAGNDPVLAAELLRMANSPFFGGREVRSLGRAITVLGQRTLRNLALCLAVRDTLMAEVPGVDADDFREDALLRATGARLLAKEGGRDAEEAFAAGLLQDVGMLVLLQTEPRPGFWSRWRTEDPDRRRQAEAEHFGMTHDEVVVVLAEAWHLPGELVAALGDHHAIGEDGRPPSRFARELLAADWMVAVYRGRDKARAMKGFVEVIGREEAQARELLARLPDEVALAGSGLGIRLRGELDFARVMREIGLAEPGGDVGC